MEKIDKYFIRKPKGFAVERKDDPDCAGRGSAVDETPITSIVVNQPTSLVIAEVQDADEFQCIGTGEVPHVESDSALHVPTVAEGIKVEAAEPPNCLQTPKDLGVEEPAQPTQCPFSVTLHDKKRRSFKRQWYTDRPWLEAGVFSPTKCSILLCLPKVCSPK